MFARLAANEISLSWSLISLFQNAMLGELSTELCSIDLVTEDSGEIFIANEAKAPCGLAWYYLIWANDF